MGDDSNTWIIFYMFLAVAFALGELATPGAFIMAPFAVGSVAGAITSAFTDGATMPLLATVVVSAISFLAMRPLARHLDRSVPEVVGVGSNRLVGMVGTVVEDIPARSEQAGMVKLGGEQWRASTGDNLSIPIGTTIRVLEVTGTRLVVEPNDRLDAPAPRHVV